MIPADFRARVEAWIADDPDERDQAELRALLAAGSTASSTAATADSTAATAGRTAAAADSTAAATGSAATADSTAAAAGSAAAVGSAAAAELADRFGGRLEFGTAGLRGAVAAGPTG